MKEFEMLGKEAALSKVKIQWDKKTNFQYL